MLVYIMIIIYTSYMSKNKCEKCKYEWIARVEKPKQCPNCKGRIKYK